MKANTGIKKLFSLLLCICMLLSMNSPAFAAEVEEITCTHDAATEPVAPTCITPGNENIVCSLCGELIDNSIPATGIHNYVNGICANDGCGLVATCNKAEDCPAAAGHDADCLSQLCDKCGNPNHNNSCPCSKEATCPANDDAHEADCVKKLTDEANKAKIAEVNALIAALPETITVDNYASVMAQLEAIKANETEMGELWNQLDLAKLNAVINATYAASTLEGCVCTAKCDVATTTCVYCLNSTCPRGEAVAKIGEVGYDSLDAALKAANAMTSAVTITICGVAVYSDSSPNLAATPGSISFVGEGPSAEIRITRNGPNGYICGAGSAPAVSFSNLILSKPAGGHASDAGFMNCGFTTYRVASVSYSGCTFPNGAAAGGCATNYSGCTFGKSHDKYALWLYGNPDVNVDNCNFDCDRGVKMYSVLGAEPELSVTNSDFSKLTGKPAIVMTHAESVSLSGNTYSETGTLELESGAQGAAFSSTDPVVCKTEDSGGTLQPSGVLVDGKIYITVADAAAKAEEGSTVTLLHDSAETVELPVGVTLDKGSFEAGGVTVAATVAKIGETPYASLQEAIDNVKNGETINLLADCSGTFTVNKSSVSFIIDGKISDTQKAKLAGGIKIGVGQNVTIRNIDFVVGADTGDSFIYNAGSPTGSNYNTVMVVDGCSFTGSGSSPVAITTKHPTNITVKNSYGTGLHSLIQNTGGHKVTVDNVTIENSARGMSLGTVVSAEIKNCTISVGADKYGIRVNAENAGHNVLIENCTVDAFIPVCVRKATTVSNISFSGNTMTQRNSDGYWCVIGFEEYEENGVLPTSGLDKVFVSGLSAQQEEGVYGGVFAEASIGSKLYPTLREAIAAAKDGDTVKLLRDIELSSTLIIGDPNDAFNKIGITVDGSGKTIKAVGSGWNDNMWLVDVTYNAAISNLTIDGGNTGCKGLQFYTSNSSLTNAVIKNISADKWGYTDYALHSNASNVALSGVSLVDCKHGHIIVDIGSSTGRTESVINATGSVSGATVILNNAGAKATTAQDGLTVIKGTDAGIAGHILVYENGSYVLVAAKASIGSTAYPSVEAALAAAKDGDTVTLLTDAGDISVSSSITLDLNGNNLNGDITVAQGKTLSVSEEDLAAAGSLSFADSLGNVKIGDEVIGLEDGTLAATAAGLSVTPSGAGKSYVRFNDMFVGVPAGQSLTVNADGSAKIPAGGSVVFAGSFEVPVASESTLAANGTLTLYPAEVQNYGYGKVTVTYGESAKSETVFVPAGKSLTVKADKNGKPVYDSSAEEAPIVTAGSVEKPKLSITPSKKAFYKFGLGTLSFTCNGFCDTLDTVYVDGVGLNDTAYTIQRGSTIVKLKNDYLKTLALGDHTLKLTYADGQSVTATISIVNTPVTGDSGYGIFAAGMGISLMGMLCVLFVLKKKRANN